MSGPPKEGTPNGGDRLAEIEGRSREELSVDPWLAYPNDRRLETARDVLALVEIAATAIENAEQNPVTHAHRKALEAFTDAD